MTPKEIKLAKIYANVTFPKQGSACNDIKPINKKSNGKRKV